MAKKDFTSKPKLKKCKVCKNRFQLFRSTQKVCSPNCALELASINAAKKEKKHKRETDKQSRKGLREFNRKDLTWQHKQTQPRFNRMRVLQELKWFADHDLEPTCISCQKPLGGDQWCCGHFKTQGGNGRLRYDELNTYLQHNRSCNMGKSGDVKNYEMGIKDRFGNAAGSEVVNWCETHTGPLKRTWQEIEAIRKECNQTIRELEKENV